MATVPKRLVLNVPQGPDSATHQAKSEESATYRSAMLVDISVRIRHFGHVRQNHRHFGALPRHSRAPDVLCYIILDLPQITPSRPFGYDQV